MSDKEELVVSSEDSRNIREFFGHFKIDIPDYLEAALVAFEEGASLKTQALLRSATCRAVVTSEHPILKDELFQEAMEASKDITFRENFDKDTEEFLTRDKDGKPVPADLQERIDFFGKEAVESGTDPFSEEK